MAVAPSRRTPPTATSAPSSPRPAQSLPLLVGLGISALVHLLLILLDPSLVGFSPSGRPMAGPTAPAAAPAGIEVLAIVEVPSVPGEPEPEPPEPERAVPTPRTPGADPPDAAAPGAPVTPAEAGPRRSAAERLRPTLRDPRLWAPIPEDVTALSDEQRAELELRLAIQDAADSIAAVEEAARRASDWTYTDAEGRRWGVSPGQIHLGDLTIPFPYNFSAPVNSDAARRARVDEEIAGQAGRAEAAETLRDRAREIRRRRDAERAAPDSGGVRR